MISPVENYSGKTGVPTFYIIEDFKERVVAGEFTNNDGVGYYANAEKISSVKVILAECSEPEEAPKDENGNATKQRNRMANGTHVAWFPKGK